MLYINRRFATLRRIYIFDPCVAEPETAAFYRMCSSNGAVCPRYYVFLILPTGKLSIIQESFALLSEDTLISAAEHDVKHKPVKERSCS
ncbi:hypothetical protein H8B06_07765 [Sphingobacterium sp. DN00404]|uniref:Uncharacterized protein n=1 Tax=Sphingobacterium micropteri TaxID=2763501 RepID=A0ABR7YN13_9SPHI|nr:hypothetical protein [Sphingobacterium micropteri]MBD1432715.1 hypothetical protein [Sphingobacterium micropteri]